MGEKSIRGARDLPVVADAMRQKCRPRRAAAPTSGLRARKAPIQICAMRTGSFHRTISPARHLAMPAPPALTPSQSKQRLDGYARVDSVVKSPDLPVSISATFSGHQVQKSVDGILTSARTVVGQQRSSD
jgi:hypothetical protein